MSDLYCNACIMGYCEFCWLVQEGMLCACRFHPRVFSVDDLIDQWHEGDDGVELHEFLGMTWDEYKNWFNGHVY